MRPEIHWIELSSSGRLAIMARPRAGDWLEDEVAGWRAEGIDTVVSLLQADEAHELGLSLEPDLCKQNTMEFISYPIPDRGVPASRRDTAVLGKAIADWTNEGKA